jgi:CubicO group peptidase (beta-lactamase class C family)
MRARYALLLAAAWVAGAATPDAKRAGMDPQRLDRIPARMLAFVDRGEIAGAVTLVARHGLVAALDTVGWQDLEAKKPMRADTIFQIMSMTKPVTATAVLLLAEEGKLGLNDPVEKHLPEVRGQWMLDRRDGDAARALKKPSRPITIRDLLTHTSGMPQMPPPGLAELYTKMDRTLAEAVAVFAQQPLEFEPGTKWLYSNPGIATLGRIVEVTADQPFERFLEERIFRPLGMKDSFFFPPEEKKPRIAVVYRSQGGKLGKAGADILGGDSTAHRKGAKFSGPEFGMYTTAADLAAFYEMMRAGGVYQRGRLLSKAAVEVMTALHTGTMPAGHMPGTGFGLAWEVVREPLGTLNLLSIGTFGHGGAFGTHGWIDKAKDLVGVFLVQHSGGAVTSAKYAFMTMAAAAVIE